MLWVGLVGNPGQSYASNRHNVGFMALDQIARDYSFSDWKVKGAATHCEGRIGGGEAPRCKAVIFHE